MHHKNDPLPPRAGSLFLSGIGVTVSALCIIYFVLNFANVRLSRTDQADMVLHIKSATVLVEAQSRAESYLSNVFSGLRLSNALAITLFAVVCLDGLLFLASFWAAKKTRSNQHALVQHETPVERE